MKGKRRKFDPILKNVFANSLGAILRIAGVSPREVKKIKLLPTEIRITKALRLDLLTEIPKFIVHFEIQNFPDPKLPRRMFLYYVSIELWQEREVEQKRRKKDEMKPILQVVIWLGEGNPPPAEYRTPTTVHKYHVIDMRKVSPDVFLRSENPYEVLLALLAGRSVVRRRKVSRAKKGEWNKEVLQKVIRRLRELVKTEKEFLKYIEDIEVLASLFGLDVEVKDMIKGEVDITKTSLFQEGRKEGKKEGERIGFRKGEKVGEKKGEKKGRIDELKKVILLGVQLKFGKGKAKFVSGKIRETDDIKKLRRIYTNVIKSQSWSEFLFLLNGSRRKKNK